MREIFNFNWSTVSFWLQKTIIDGWKLKIASKLILW